MNVLGLRKYPMSKFRFPGDFQTKLDSDDSALLAKSFEDIGEIHDPVVRLVGDHVEVLAGERRLAAHIRLKHKTVVCKLVSCTDEEASRIRLAENAHREHNPERQRREMDELVEALARPIVKENPTVRKRGAGRSLSAAGMARRQLAAERGVSENTIKVQEWRAAKRREAEALGLTRGEYETLKERGELPRGGRPPERPNLPPIKTLNMELDEDFETKMYQVQKFLDEAESLTKKAASHLKMAMEEELPVRKEELERAVEELTFTAKLIHSTRPWSLCHACKGIEAVQNECVTCRQAGYVTREEESRMPRELLNIDEPVVLYRTAMRPVAEFASPEPAEDLDPFAGMQE